MCMLLHWKGKLLCKRSLSYSTVPSCTWMDGYVWYWMHLIVWYDDVVWYDWWFVWPNVMVECDGIAVICSCVMWYDRMWYGCLIIAVILIVCDLIWSKVIWLHDLIVVKLIVCDCLWYASMWYDMIAWEDLSWWWHRIQIQMTRFFVKWCTWWRRRPRLDWSDGTWCHLGVRSTSSATYPTQESHSTRRGTFQLSFLLSLTFSMEPHCFEKLSTLDIFGCSSSCHHLNHQLVWCILSNLWISQCPSIRTELVHHTNY